MLSWIALIVVLAALVVLGTWASGRILGRGTVMDRPDAAVDRLADNRGALARGDLSGVHFDVVPRGYRQDQVDDLLAAVEERLNRNAARG